MKRSIVVEVDILFGLLYYEEISKNRRVIRCEACKWAEVKEA